MTVSELFYVLNKKIMLNVFEAEITNCYLTRLIGRNQIIQEKDVAM